MSSAPTLISRVRSRNDLDDAMKALGKMQTQSEKLKLAKAKKQATLDAEFNKAIADADAVVSDQLTRIRDYVAEHRALVLGDEKSTILEGGEITVRKLPVKVDCHDEEEAISYLQSHGLDQFVRVSVAVDKNALKKERVNIPGISYLDREQLVVTPITSGDKIAVELS